MSCVCSELTSGYTVKHSKWNRGNEIKPHLWQPSCIPLSSVGESSITIASVLSPILEPASISLLEAKNRNKNKIGRNNDRIGLFYRQRALHNGSEEQRTEKEACFLRMLLHDSTGTVGVNLPCSDWRSRGDAEAAAWFSVQPLPTWGLTAFWWSPHLTPSWQWYGDRSHNTATKMKLKSMVT